MNYKLAIFDLDGTILNTLEDLTDSVNYALLKNGMSLRGIEEVRQFVGNGIGKLMERAVERGTDAKKTEQVLSDFKEYYGANCARKTRPYDGIGKLLSVLRANGIRTAVVSNKADFAVQTLCRHYFPGMFDRVAGEKEGIRRKPYPDSVLYIMEQLGVAKEETIYIGDSEVDVKTAENAGINVISVTWGFRGEDFLRAEGAKVFAHHPEELKELICGAEKKMKRVKITKECSNVKKMGRILYHDEVCYLVYSAAQVGFTYTGDKLSAELVTDFWCHEKGFEGVAGVFVGEDEEPWKRFLLQKEEGEYELFDRKEYAKSKNLAESELPRALAIRIVKYSEAAFGAVGIRALLVDAEAELFALPDKKHRLEFIGDSITCGYGNEGVCGVDLFNTAQENPMKAYAVRTAMALDADYMLVSWSGIGLVSDYIPPEREEPDETILAGENYKYTAMKFCENMGFEKEAWDFSAYTPDVVVINLGTNDDSYTRQLPEREAVYAEKYEELYRFLREKYPQAHIVCCLGIMARGLDATLGRLVDKLKKQGDNRIYFVEFEGQKDEDGIGTDFHPSLKTHGIAAERLTKAITEILQK